LLHAAIHGGDVRRRAAGMLFRRVSEGAFDVWSVPRATSDRARLR
jgi:hypothetical protein